MANAPAYPAHWEADVLLADGSAAHLRPIAPSDADRLVEFYERVSDESKYYRFFAPYPRLTETDVRRFTHVDHLERVALILLRSDDMIAVGRWDRIDESDAEVAFLVEDDQQGRGIGSVLLEHLAQAGRERDVHRFVADVLPQNRKMIQVFRDAGYTVANAYEDGVIHLEFPIEATESSLDVMAAREHRAEARSIQRLLRPHSVAVVGASRSPGKLGQVIVRNLVLGGFTGPVYAVNPETPAVTGVPAFATVSDIPGEVDLAVIAVPVEAVPDAVLDCAAKGVKGLVVVSGGFAEAGGEGRERQLELVRVARSNGMRVVGPNGLGIINTDPEFSLNASVSPVMPESGRIGFFTQSGALGTPILQQVVDRGLGLSTFVSAGNRADVSGNDLLQYWEEDPNTDVVLLYLESIGNPRKFTRLARRVGRKLPVVAVKSGRATQGVPIGHAVGRSELPDAAMDALFRQAGVVRVDTVAELFDVAAVLALQPLPAGGRVAVLGNSNAIGLLAADAAVSAGLEMVGGPVDLGSGAGPAEFEQALSAALADPVVDSVVVVFAEREADAADVAPVLAAIVASSAKPVVSTFLGARGVPAAVRQGGRRKTDRRRGERRGAPERGSLPSYPSPEEAVRALAHATAYARWRARPAGEVPEIVGLDSVAARILVQEALATSVDGAPVVLDHAPLRLLLQAYGIPAAETVAVATLDEAFAVLERMQAEGVPDVVLKGTAEQLRHRPDLADVWRNIDTRAEMQAAWENMSQTLADPAEAEFVVQPMAVSGVPVAIRSREDELFGPVVSFGVSGVATQLLGDRSYRIPPLTDGDAAEMVREVKASPLLFGYRGGPIADVAAVQDLLHRTARLTDDLPELVYLELDPVLVAPQGLVVVNAAARVAPPPERAGWYVRRLG